MKHRDIIKKMTLEEKCAYLSGKNAWDTRSFTSIGVDVLHHADGPTGVRKQAGKGDHLGLNASVPATCFPTAATLANSWDKELLERVGRGLGAEAAAEDVNVLLGPGINIKRNPLCGRNFEYYSEDPYLSGKLAAAMIRGIQSNGTASCVKHFAVNSQELRRMAMDAVLDERTLREIYITAFEIAIKEGHPKSVMTSYNMVNGVYANENEHLLMDILRKDLGFDGMVVTDWGASNDHALGVKNGSSLEMPAPGLDSARELLDALKVGKIKESDIDARVDELIEITLATKNKKKPKDKAKMFADNHALAKEAAKKSIVLLKNEDNILPLNGKKKIAVIGDFAFNPRYQGAGSSMVNPTKVDMIQSILAESDLEVIGTARGYSRLDKEDDAVMTDEAMTLARKADIVLYFFGLNEASESEGLDRTHLRIPKNQIDLLERLSIENHNIVGIISAGSCIKMPWEKHLKAILHGYLFGQAGMGAVFELLTGKYNPSGKLSETIVKRYEDEPNIRYYPSKERTSEYRESIFVGYRYFTTRNVDVLYPFGYGLSYTDFKYSDIEVDDEKVSFFIENIGKVTGEEVAQLYIGLKNSNVFRAKFELKGFEKVELAPGEKKKITIRFDDKSFRFYNVMTNAFEIESGEYDIYIGSSCEDIRLQTTLKVSGNAKVFPYNKKELPSYYSGDIRKVSDTEYRALLGRDIPNGNWSGELGINDALCQMYYAKSFIARFAYRILDKRLKKSLEAGVPDLNTLFHFNMPFRAIGKMSNGQVSMEMVDSIVLLVNGHFFKGMFGIISGYFKNKKANKKYKREFLQRED
ncbi:beta-glucosidase family protein [Lachnoanaerobaculum saburreum]|uniref:Glycosyl hydrolase family 3 N-terminal domain protein n=1 Tax=Lachnoanaerobaculum saburreum DSM 3986 TaxID=887325 RepID=E6LRU1_9FIRM|nr:glycoside hydrolase family 3 C-terminal domain-containing protein [Lachnoanaerobaculum saburreum]EFU75318.1 glycosyl hydrolase family 3 N-terminal domain protein [Lachnoanaerobaculum saburreum DSM 3986]